MEPRRDDGDDLDSIIREGADFLGPQWSPVVTTGTTCPQDGWDSGGRHAPQWSPVVTTGTTLPDR